MQRIPFEIRWVAETTRTHGSETGKNLKWREADTWKQSEF